MQNVLLPSTETRNQPREKVRATCKAVRVAEFAFYAGGLKETTAHALDKPNKKKSVGDESGGHDPALRADGSIEVKLSFKRYMFDARKQMLQI